LALVSRHTFAIRLLWRQERGEGLSIRLRGELIPDKSNVRVRYVKIPAMKLPQSNGSIARLPNKPQPGAADLPTRGRRPGNSIRRAEMTGGVAVRLGYPTRRSDVRRKIAPAFADL